MMIPSVIKEDLVTLFNYWNDGLQEGMALSGNLYACVRAYSTESRLDAYQLGCKLAEKGMQVCVTCSSSRYTVWMDLKSTALTDPQNTRVGAVEGGKSNKETLKNQ